MAHGWVLPILYHSITFLNAADISRFYAAHNTLDETIEKRLLLTRSIWIGHTEMERGDLSYASSSWPITIIHRILWLCTNVRALFIINLSQNDWPRLEGVIPSSLETLAMGPIHGPFYINQLTKKPRIRSFTSAETFMRDDEVWDIVMHPHMRTFRRIVDTSSSFWVFDQLSCISKSTTLEEMQLFFTEDTPILTLEPLKDKLAKVTDDERVSIQQCVNWIGLLRAEFRSERNAFLGELYAM